MQLERRGLMFVLSSPSGAGKTTLSRRLQAVKSGDPENPSLVMSVSVTTRKARPGEVHGKDYFFITPAEYDALVAQGELLENAKVFDYCYGTPRSFVREHLSRGVDVLFDIDWQGTRQLKEAMRDDLVSVFILPPSMAELERRLKSRAQDSDEVVAGRMGKARAEIDHWDEYDYVLINDDFDATLEKISSILEAERLKRARQVALSGFVHSL